MKTGKYAYRYALVLAMIIVLSNVAGAVENPKNPVKKSLQNKANVSNDDTLVFEKSYDDTLIFADDEVQNEGPANSTDHGGSFYSGNTSEEQPLKVDLFPNPCVYNCTLHINQSEGQVSEIFLFSLKGELLRKDIALGDTYILDNLPSGVYMVWVKTSGELVKKKLFVN